MLLLPTPRLVIALVSYHVIIFSVRCDTCVLMEQKCWFVNVYEIKYQLFCEMSLIMSKWIRRGGTEEKDKEWMYDADGGKLSECGRLWVRCESSTRMNVREREIWERKSYGNGWGSCPVVGFLIIAVELTGYNTEDWNLLFFNSLKTKCRPLYLKTQSVPRCKHFSSLL